MFYVPYYHDKKKQLYGPPLGVFTSMEEAHTGIKKFIRMPVGRLFFKKVTGEDLWEGSGHEFSIAGFNKNVVSNE